MEGHRRSLSDMTAEEFKKQSLDDVHLPASILRGHEGVVWGVAWSWDGKTLASCGQDKTIKLWQHSTTTNSWELTDELKGAHSKSIRSVAFSPCGRFLAAGSFDALVSLWRRPTKANGSAGWKCILNLEGHENEVKCVKWSPDGRLLSTCGRDKTVWIWEVSTCDVDALADGILMDASVAAQVEDENDPDLECLAVLAEHTQDVKGVAFHPLSSNLLVSASYDDTIRVWKSHGEDDWLPSSTISAHKATVWACDFSSDGHYMASVGADCLINIYRVTDQKKIEYMFSRDFAHERPIYSVSWQPVLSMEEDYNADSSTQSRLLATVGDDRRAGIWSFDPVDWTLNRISTYEDDRLGFNQVAWNPKDASLVALAADDGTIRLLQIAQ